MKHAALAYVLLLLTAALSAQEAGAVLLVLNKDEATLSVIDPESGRTLGKVTTGPNPHEVTVSSDGRLAVVTNYAGDSLSVIDIGARKELQRVRLPDLRQPHGIATVGGTVVFTAEGNQAVAGYDPVKSRIDWRVATGQAVTHMVTATRDGRTLVTANIGSNSITILERDGETWRTSHVAVGAGPEGLDLSPDDRELWTAHSGDSRVSIVDVRGKRVLHALDAGTQRANRLKFTRDGRYVLISDMAAGELVVVDARTRTVAKRLRVGRQPEGILVPPDGDRIYVAVTGDNRVIAVHVNRLEVVQTIATGRGPDGMAWATSVRRPE